MKATRQAGRNRWALALLVSALVHVLAVVGFWSWPMPRSQPLPPAFLMLTMAGAAEPEEGGGEVALAPGSQKSPAPQNPSPANTLQEEPATMAPPFHGKNLTNHSRLQNGGGPGIGQGTFFGVPARGQRIVYVIDGSGSMGKYGALAVARAELYRSLKSLPAEARFQVIVYNHAARPLLAGRPGWLQPTPQFLQEAGQALLRLPAEGSTNHALGLQAGLLLQPDVLFFLTDADHLTQEHLRLVARLNVQDRTTIHAIELNLRNRGRPAMPMQLLARGNRGDYQAVDPAAIP